MSSTAEQLEQTIADNAQLQERIALLTEENRWLKAQLFGRSSEKHKAPEISPDQVHLAFNEAEAIAATTPFQAVEPITVAAHARKPRGRQRLPAALPRVDVVHDVPAAERVCAHDGTALVRIGEEISEQLDYQPAQLRILRHVRPKYACPGCQQGVRIAPVPNKLLPKAQAAPSLLAHITTAKYVDGLPLHRQEAQFARLGVNLTRATMARWMIEIGQHHVVPIINLLNDELLAAPLVHMDETRLQVLRSDKPPTSDHWMWVRAAGPPGQRIVLFDYDPSRAGSVPTRLLAGFSGILLTDGYEAYDAVVKTQGLVHAGCLAHARRRFEDARKVNTDSQSSARLALDLIGQLYSIEHPLKDAAPAERLAVRMQRSAPIMSRFHAWLNEMAAQVLPQSALGKAVRYTLGQWPKLSHFLAHGEIPLDNNRCENAIRPFVIGRKGWLFSDTPAGAQASANLYSLVETAKANGVEPHAYLTHLYTELPHATTVEHLEALLPWHVKTALRVAG